MLNFQQPSTVGYILTIGQSISIVLAPWKPQRAQQMTTWLKSKKYWKEWKQPYYSYPETPGH